MGALLGPYYQFFKNWWSMSAEKIVFRDVKFEPRSIRQIHKYSLVYYFVPRKEKDWRICPRSEHKWQLEIWLFVILMCDFGFVSASCLQDIKQPVLPSLTVNNKILLGCTGNLPTNIDFLHWFTWDLCLHRTCRPSYVWSCCHTWFTCSCGFL